MGCGARLRAHRPSHQPRRCDAQSALDQLCIDGHRNVYFHRVTREVAEQAEKTAMRRSQGYSIITEPDKPTIEQDTFTCSHCNRVTFLKPRQEPEHRCNVCVGYICEGRANRPCLPLEEQLRMMESPRYRPYRVFSIRKPST